MITGRGLECALLMVALMGAGPAAAEEPRKFDLSKDKVLYCVGYAHLDTQWRWDFCTTIDRYVYDTLTQNFERFEKYPGYVFNFTGSVRYEMMREYYPELYAKLKKYVADGRWIVSGSSVDEGDVNVPGAETIIRHVLYGNQFFRREFNKESLDFMLPDCFGFPASMPSIWAHCGLLGFSTQKLTWGSAVGIPFKIGVWEGLDGRSVIAAFDPGPYVGAIEGRVDTNPQWVARVNANGEKYGVYADYHYYGVGDMGGAPKEKDIANYLASIDQPDSQIKVALTSSDQMYRDITPEQKERLPRYKGDLLLTEHSAGTLTSESYMKRWNRKNEQLADGAERAAVFAHWLGGAVYPREKLYRSWVRMLANQMHDILPGTSIPRAYTYSWNDEIIAMNGMAAVLTDSVGAVSRALDTRGEGVPLVIYNPLATEREDPVEAEVLFDGALPAALRVFDAEGREAPCQELSRGGNSVRLLVLAKVPSVGFTVYHVRPAEKPYDSAGGLVAEDRRIENEHYRVTLNDAGDVASIRDKAASGERELLSAPAQLVFTYEKPKNWPAWNMDWADRQKPPLGVVDGPAKIRVVERGPVRVAIEVQRESRNSIVTQRIRLARGDAGRRIEFESDIDWQSAECALRAAFPLAVANPKATYNWEVGTIQRGNNDPVKYEVPSHQWFDLTDASGEYGVSVLEDSKYGSDKPADNTLRLTLLYTPGVRKGYLDQHSQDWGRHDILYGLYGHTGDWRQGQSEWQARRLNQPLRAFQTRPHEGSLGKSASLLKVSTPQVDVRAVKLAEESEWVVLRLQELWSRAAEEVEISLAAPVLEAREIDGQERPLAGARVTVSGGTIRTKLDPATLQSIAVRLAAPKALLEKPVCKSLDLAFDTDVVSSDANRTDGAFDAEGRAIPAEMLPERIESEGIVFRRGPVADKQLQALTCRGQKLELPAGEFDHVYFLAAAAEDVDTRLAIGDQETAAHFGAWTGFVGQWDNRVWDRPLGEVDFVGEGKVTAIEPAFIKRDAVAWFATHRHHPKLGNESYRFSYLFKYGFALPAGARSITLPNDERVRVLAITAARNPNEATRPAAPLYDDFTNRVPVKFRHEYPPPPAPAFEGVTPTAKATVERASKFESLQIGPPSKKDFADRSSSNGKVQFRFVNPDDRFPPHPGSGPVDGAFPRLNDGDAAQSDDDTKRSVWYDNEGRFYVDLQRSVPIARVNTYSRHRANRAPQYFSLWGASGAEMPAADFGGGSHEGWSLLAVVDSRSLGQGGVHASSVTAGDGKSIGPYRYLLWVAEDVGQGTFFSEADVHVAE